MNKTNIQKIGQPHQWTQDDHNDAQQQSCSLTSSYKDINKQSSSQSSKSRLGEKEYLQSRDTKNAKFRNDRGSGSHTDSESYYDTISDQELVEDKKDIYEADTDEYNEKAFHFLPINNITIGPFKQRRFKTDIIRDNQDGWVKQSSKLMITSGLAPDLQVADGLYIVEKNQITFTVRNSSFTTIILYNDEPIKGLVGHKLSFVQRKVKSSTTNPNKPDQGNLINWHFKTKMFKVINSIRKLEQEEADKGNSTKENLPTYTWDINPKPQREVHDTLRPKVVSSKRKSLTLICPYCGEEDFYNCLCIEDEFSEQELPATYSRRSKIQERKAQPLFDNDQSSSFSSSFSQLLENNPLRE